MNTQVPPRVSYYGFLNRIRPRVRKCVELQMKRKRVTTPNEKQCAKLQQLRGLVKENYFARLKRERFRKNIIWIMEADNQCIACNRPQIKAYKLKKVQNLEK